MAIGECDEAKLHDLQLRQRDKAQQLMAIGECDEAKLHDLQLRHRDKAQQPMATTENVTRPSAARGVRSIMDRYQQGRGQAEDLQLKHRDKAQR